MTAIELITKEDLKQLESRLLSAISALEHPEGGAN